MESLSHGVLYKVLIIGRNGRDICSGIARVWRLSMNRDEESGVMCFVV